MKKLNYNGGFETEGGHRFNRLEIAYKTWGKLNSRRDNVIWVCHALTANADIEEWWPEMVGEGMPLDTSRWFVVCANIPGSCYGSTGPLSINEETGKPWFHTFPGLTTRDLVNSHELLRKHLGINGIKCVIGSSIGGHQALEYAIMKPGLVQQLVFIASNARQSPWAIAFNESQRMALEADPSFFAGREEGGTAGLIAARSIAMLSYRNPGTYNLTQDGLNHASNGITATRPCGTREATEPNSGSTLLPGKAIPFRASTYQRYQGEKLARRFNAWSYHILTRVSDSHDCGRNRGGIEKALSQVTAKTLAIAVKSDILFPPEEIRRVADGVPDGRYVEIDSPYGHDGFLTETDIIGRVIEEFLGTGVNGSRKKEHQNRPEPIKEKIIENSTLKH
ncbi:MAG: homoserine O-acetyltransferase [Bacteroidales bacterium]|nr:homoserine O-acetyltransferase [Bacteroidales bacterium]